MMLNNPMPNKDNQSKPLGPEANLPRETIPNESAGFAVEAFVKIYDPKTQETFLETRA